MVDQLAVYLARCLILYDQSPWHGECAQSQYSCLYDTLSCYFYTTLQLGHCQSILTLTQHSDEPEKACYRISPFDTITCSKVGPMSFEWPVASPGGFDQSSLSPSREDKNDEHIENAHLAPLHSRWGRDALQPPEIQRARIGT